MMDSDSIKKLYEGEPQALAELYDEFGGRIYKSALFLADSREEAEDMVQETFVRAFRAIRRFEGRSSLYTWLYRILLNVAHDLIRKKYVRKKFASMNRVEEFADPIEKLSASIDHDQFAQSLRAALACQKMKHRQVIVLRFFEELKLGEISARLGIGIGTVKSRLHHALKGIKKLIPNIEQYANRRD